MNNKVELDHADIVTTHACNGRCQFCIDKFIHTDDTMIELSTVEKFMQLLRNNTDKDLEVLLLGGDPTVLPLARLIAISDIIRKYNFRPIMSTNGILKEKVKLLLPYYDWIQVTAFSKKDIDYWDNYSDKINIKWSGDRRFNIEALHQFVENSKNFKRRSVTMYFKPDFTELCEDEKVWELLDTLDWSRNGSYEYSFYEGVRFKKCIKGETNIIDEPTVPKVYPNGNYNKTWNNEELDHYLKGEW